MVPVAPAARYVVQRGPKAAIASFEEVLKLRPGDVRARWLLNLSALALDAAVPAGLEMPPFKSDADIGAFKNIAVDVGLRETNLAGGAAVDDFDGDGDLDIVASDCNPAARLHYWRNDGDGRFTERGEAAGLAGQLGGLNLVQTDYDNDGRLDLFVMRGGWMRDDGRQRNSLLHNDGGVFRDVTHAAGLDLPACPCQTCAWADFDNDGDLDVFVGNESQGTRFPAQLFRNNGDGTFTDVAQAAGVANHRYCKGATAGDYDGDGRIDLYVSNFGEANRLYHNEGGLCFRDVAEAAGVMLPLKSFPAWFFDYDNDGRLDLFVAGYGREVAHVAADHLGLDHDGPRLTLYHNRGDGTFEDVTKAAGLYRTHLVMGSSYGDLDNDGWPDFFLGTGFPAYDGYEPNRAYRNDAGRRFQDVTFSGGFGHLPKGHGIAFADLDNDGDQDVFVQLGGFFTGDVFYNALFKNPGHGNHWLTLKLVGVNTNRAAVGTPLVVTTPSGRKIHAVVGTGGSYGGNSLQVELGLGPESGPVDVRIAWPRTESQSLSLAADASYEITEGAPPKRIDRAVIRFP